MQETKAILEKIERPRNKDELVPAWWIRDNILSFVDQALAKLKEAPEPSEFTKNIMANLERWDLLPKEKDCRIRTIIAWLKEVCRRYDWLVKRNAELHAENKQLVEGQVARKEAGS